MRRMASDEGPLLEANGIISSSRGMTDVGVTLLSLLSLEEAEKSDTSPGIDFLQGLSQMAPFIIVKTPQMVPFIIVASAARC